MCACIYPHECQTPEEEEQQGNECKRTKLNVTESPSGQEGKQRTFTVESQEPEQKMLVSWGLMDTLQQAKPAEDNQATSIESRNNKPLNVATMVIKHLNGLSSFYVTNSRSSIARCSEDAVAI